MAPVDYVSRAIVYLSRQEASVGRNFNLINPNPIDWSALLDWIRSLGYGLRDVPYDLFRLELARSSTKLEAKDSLALLAIFPERGSAEGATESEVAAVDCTNALDGLRESSVRCAPADSKLLATYMAYLLRTGYLPPPPREEGSIRGSG
jgi:hypothetical protein